MLAELLPGQLPLGPQSRLPCPLFMGVVRLFGFHYFVSESRRWHTGRLQLLGALNYYLLVGIDRCTYGTSTIWYRTVGTYGTVP